MNFQDIMVIGVDLGGTNIRTALLKGKEIIKTASTLVPQTSNANEVLEKVAQTIQKVWNKNVVAIGIGIPGIIDKNKGIVYDIQNIPSWQEVAVKDFINNTFSVDTFLNNDANCFALGEFYFGKSRGVKNYVGLAIGTGIGGGIINNGKLLDDAFCGSGEFGMLPYKDSIYEDYCSGQFFKKQYNTDGQIAYEKAIKGDKNAIKIFKELGFHLGNLIKSVYYTISPEQIVLGGTVTKSYPLFKKTMWNELNTFAYKRIKDNFKIEISDLEHAAILGAASLCFSNSKKLSL